MGIPQVLVLAVLAMGLGQLKQSRSTAMLTLSCLVIFWLQPHQEPVSLSYWFPVLTLCITVLCWVLASTREVRGWNQNRTAFFVISGVILLVGLNRYLKLDSLFVAETPRIQWILLLLVIFAAGGFSLAKMERKIFIPLAIIGLIALLVILKLPPAAGRLYDLVAGMRGKDAGGLAGVSWLGFSYVAFRLMHTLLDRRSGRLASVPLSEYVNYVIFFPAFTAGPIDRIDRFVAHLRQPLELDRPGWVDAGIRLFTGLFKKFVLADGLAWFALNTLNAGYLQSQGPSWILLYAYSFRIYFDFSGYTDIAIGLGRLAGLRLPENFDSPYLKSNITQFWNSWHMTLTQWFRAYFFNPLTRSMRSAWKAVPDSLMILIAQVATMALIGLWHGITTGFLLWGIWNGLGLFIHNRWIGWFRPRQPAWTAGGAGLQLMNISGIFITFNFVSLGWLFFNLQDPALVWRTLQFLFGAG